jgi:hypothetical protein
MTDNIYIIFVKRRGRGSYKWYPINEVFFYKCDAAMEAAKRTVKYPMNKYKIKKYVEVK